MANKKGTKIEPGIWRREGGDGYIAELSYAHPQTGRRTREQKTTNRLDLAREWRQTRKADALRGEIRKTKKTRAVLPFEKYADEYIENCSKLDKRESTYKRERGTMRLLKRHFGRRLLGEFVRRDVEQYMSMRRGEGVKPNTVNRELMLIKHMFRKAVDWDYVETNPAAGVKLQRVELPEFNILSEEEIDCFIEQATPHLKGVFILALNTGLRKGELFRLEWRDVDFERGLLAVRRTKNYETRYVPMNAMVREALRQQPKMIVGGERCPLVFANAEGKSYSNIDKGFAASKRRAGITKHFRIHDMRHTFASLLVMRGVDLRTVAKLLGHKDIKQTMRYAHLAPDHLQAAVEVLVVRGRSGQAECRMS